MQDLPRRKQRQNHWRHGKTSWVFLVLLGWRRTLNIGHGTKQARKAPGHLVRFTKGRDDFTTKAPSIESQTKIALQQFRFCLMSPDIH